MADLLTSKPGKVVVVSPQDGDSGFFPGHITLSGAAGEFSSMAALIAGIDVVQETDQQFQRSLNRAIYVYTFGDLMGSVVIHGVAFPEECGGDIGLEAVFNFYKASRLSKSAATCQVFVADQVITGFLTKLTVETQGFGEDPSAFLNRFSMVINALPDD